MAEEGVCSSHSAGTFALIGPKLFSLPDACEAVDGAELDEAGADGGGLVGAGCSWPQADRISPARIETVLKGLAADRMKQ
jgi:hypothetical protein